MEYYICVKMVSYFLLCFSLGCLENEETEGSDVPADYLLGDVEGDEDDLYMLDHENPPSESVVDSKLGPFQLLCLCCWGS